MENFNVRNFCEEKFLRITHIETKTFFDFRSLAFEFKEKQFFASIQFFIWEVKIRKQQNVLPAKISRIKILHQ